MGELYAFGLLAHLKDVEYGYVTPTGQRRTNIDEHEFYRDYRLSDPQTLLKNKLGVCWDTVEYLRSVCTKYPFTSIYLELEQGNSHTVSIIEAYPKGLFIVEHSYAKYRGVHGPYATVQEIAQLVLEHMRAEPDVKKPRLVYATVYTKPPYHITCQEAMDHYRAGTPISGLT